MGNVSFATGVALSLSLFILFYLLTSILKELQGIQKVLIQLPVYISRGSSVPISTNPPTAGDVSISVPSFLLARDD